MSILIMTNVWTTWGSRPGVPRTILHIFLIIHVQDTLMKWAGSSKKYMWHMFKYMWKTCCSIPGASKRILYMFLIRCVLEASGCRPPAPKPIFECISYWIWLGQKWYTAHWWVLESSKAFYKIYNQGGEHNASHKGPSCAVAIRPWRPGSLESTWTGAVLLRLGFVDCKY